MHSSSIDLSLKNNSTIHIIYGGLLMDLAKVDLALCV